MRTGAALALALGWVAASGCAKGCARQAELPEPSAAWLEGRLEPSEQAPRGGGALVVRMPQEPVGLNLLHDRMVDGWMVKYLRGGVYESLAEIDRDAPPRFPLKPLLAQAWTQSSDGLTHTLALRKGVRFHNGEPFSAADVIAVLDAIFAQKNATRSLRGLFSEIDSYRAIDDFTVEVRWKRPYFLAFRNLVTSLPVMPKSALVGDFDALAVNRAPVGTGPFRFEGWKTGESLTLARFDGYWREKPHLERVVLRFVKDHTVATQLWEHGAFDLMVGIQPNVWKAIEAKDPKNAWAINGYQRIRFVENNYSWFGWNQGRPLFRDARVRRALSLAVPYGLLEKSVDLGLEPRVACPYSVAGDSCDPSIAPLAQDLGQARALLDEAGWRDTDGDGVRDKDGQPFRFRFLASATSVRLGKLLPLYQEQLRPLGIDLEIEPVESALFMDRVRRHDFDACSMLWSSQDVWQDLFPLFHSSQVSGGFNYVSYVNPVVDAQLERIRQELDEGRRIALERGLHRMLFDDQVYTFLSARPALDAAKRRVHGLKPSLQWYDLRQVWVDP